MQMSRKHSGGFHLFHHEPVNGVDQYGYPHSEEYFTLESSTASVVYDSPAASFSSNRSPLSKQGSHSCLSDLLSSDYTHGSPVSGSSSSGEDSLWRQKLRELEMSLPGPGPESDASRCHKFCFVGGAHQADLSASWDVSQMVGMIPRLDLKKVLVACAQAIADRDIPRTSALMHVLDQMVSVSGDPIQRLGAYALEGLRARLELSGSKIYRALKCDAPIGSDLLTYMGLIYQICPYWKFAYVSANASIREAVEHEPRIHIIDFQIAQGNQWIPLIQALGARPGGPPVIRITGVDDSESAHARGGGLDIVGKTLAQVAKSVNVPFEFLDTAMSGCEVHREDLKVQRGEAIIVNFPYILHHMPDESVTTWNHRDRLLRLVKSLSPKIVTIIEQESNTNTKPFFPRFIETLDYYSAMFESIDVTRPRDDKPRLNAEQHCVARDIVNLIACEGAERVERHEPFGKWRSRLTMAGFTQQPMSPLACSAVLNLLQEYNRNYRLEERDGALYLLWKNRDMSTSSVWR